jgi:two-component system chemotaxis sensor kinase CheA
MNESSNKFLEEMADDFFSECDELLTLIRRGLLKIDNLKGTGKPPKNVLEDLLRSSHTLKGLTGMIGAEEIMTLTHTIETYLKAVYEEDISISAHELDVLFNSFSIVELQLDSLRNKKPMPDSAPVVSDVNSIIPDSYQNRLHKRGTAQLISDSADKEASGDDKGEKRWKFIFTPSRELFEKGINIDEVRTRISSLGEVVSSIPQTLPDGKISFEFVVVSKVEETTLMDWTSDGISYELLEQNEGPSGTGPKSDSGSDATDADIGHHLQKNVVRVDLNRLDDLMRSVGDLVVTRSRLSESIMNNSSKQKNELSGLNEINVLMERQLRELREGIIRLRLVSTGEAFERMRFVVRDLVGESNKSIDLKLEGEDTQIDKYVMEKMFDPLLHLVRNAVSHGIEPAEERKSSGKKASGQLLLKASASGSNVVFEIADDGYGIDREKVAEKARNIGIIGKDVIVDDTSLLDIICTPGFSTRESTDIVSGRGLGMDIVLKSVNALGGSLSMESEKGKGTRFIILLPLTLSIVDALIVRSAANIFAIPMPSVNEVISLSKNDVSEFLRNEMISYRNRILPVIRLDRFFKQPVNNSPTFNNAVVIGNGRIQAGIIVDKIIGKKEIVVRALSDPLVRVNGISGATELGEGKIVLILDAPALVRSVIREKGLRMVNSISGDGRS